ncbi:hypothetical protein Tco_1439260 [Tanacetum coccineum]
MIVIQHTFSTSNTDKVNIQGLSIQTVITRSYRRFINLKTKLPTSGLLLLASSHGLLFRTDSIFQMMLLSCGLLNTSIGITPVEKDTHLLDYKRYMEDMLLLEGTPKEGKSQEKNSVLFNDTECIVLSPNVKLIDESQVLLRVPRKNNTYSVDLKNIVPKGGLTCLFSKATSDESKLWHRRLVKALEYLMARTRIVEENLHIRFSENTPNVVGTQSNGFVGTKASDNAGQARKETEPEEPKKVIYALKDPSWIEAMQEELLQFKLQEV